MFSFSQTYRRTGWGELSLSCFLCLQKTYFFFLNFFFNESQANTVKLTKLESQVEVVDIT